MNDSELANLENECEKIVRNPNSAPQRELVSFFESPENFNTIYSIIFRSRHASLLYLCLNSCIFVISLSKLNFDFATNRMA
ncbi:hypothetical protein SteCoe_18931 [Stentor coeruleus]|uniref:Uncharacterized protein n=1 Tax=Stentor coeruleus TaxID=5963 RepID=A0A1R2BVP5_9CILI|nr:hypothetical protein SteCoe_18931 [Stentor coeruleus]